MDRQTVSILREEIYQNRIKMLQLLLAAVVIMGLVTLIFLYQTLIDDEIELTRRLLMMSPFVAMWVVLVIILFWRGLSYYLRAGVLLSLNFLLGCYLLSVNGLQGSGRLWILLLPVLAFILLGIRAGIAAGVLSILTYFFFAVTVSAGWFTLENMELTSLNFWLSEGGDFLIAVVSLIIILESFSRGWSEALDKVDRANRQLEARTRELARHNAELEQLIHATSHDLQEPLRTIVSYSQLLTRRYKNRLDGEADEYIGFAIDGALQMQALLRDLLTFLNVSTYTRPFEPVDCASTLAWALAVLQPLIEETGATVTHDDLPTITGDANQLSQVFQNLIGNALKFRGNAPPQIHVGAERQGGEWVFSVCDNGIGIEPQYFDRIFGLFQRLHTRRRYPGSGIGLAICKKIVERHGGRIWVESKPGRGTTFSFALPDVKEQPQILTTRHPLGVVLGHGDIPGEAA